MFRSMLLVIAPLTLGIGIGFPARISFADEVPPGVKEAAHRKGNLFLRAQVGFGKSSTSTSNANTTVVFDGLGHAHALAVGLSVSEKVAVYGTVQNYGFRQPYRTVIQDGRSAGREPVGDNQLLVTMGLGVGVTQYFTDHNFYWDASVHLGPFGVLPRKKDYYGTTATGIGGSLAFGKEWMVSPRVGLGAALLLRYSQAKDEGDLPGGIGEDVRSSIVAFGVSITYR